MNNVTLVGRMATNPELVETNGNPICTFRVAVDRGKADGADFIPIKCFGAGAEQHAKYLTKGRMVSVTGRISHSQWTDQNDQPRERYEVIGNRIGYLDSPRSEDSPADGDDTGSDTEPF